MRLAPILALLVGCVPVEEELVFCDGSTTFRWDPDGDTLAAWPDDVWTTAADESPTGLRLRLDPATIPWQGAVPAPLDTLLDGLDAPSGFARQGWATLRFTGPVEGLPTTLEESLDGEAVQWLDLSGDAPERVPFEVTVLEEEGGGVQVQLQPLRPLAAGARHALLVTDALRDAQGGCVAPSRPLRRMLADAETDEARAALGARLREAADAVGRRPDQLAGGVAFTTHDDLARLPDVAADFREGIAPWGEASTCEDEGERIRCRLTLEVGRYATDGVLDDATPDELWTLKVDAWLPQGEGPHPTLLFGHGLNSSRGEGSTWQRRMSELGFAVVSADALRHGEHPTAVPGDPLAALPFLGIQLQPEPRLDARALRESFLQTVIDRAQVVEALRAHPDLDGDGTDDVDVEQLGYLGVSLGGLLGPGTLALTDGLDAAALPVGGGHLIVFATDTGPVRIIQGLFIDVLGSTARFQRLLGVAQTIVDGADPAVLGAHVLRDRLVAPDHRPSVLLPVAQFDDTVPPRTGMALARGLGLPHAPPQAWEVAGLDALDTLPVSGNADGATAGYFQLDRVSGGDGVVDAEHDNTPGSAEGLEQLRTWFGTWLDSGVPTLVDPYEVLDTPPRAEE